MTPSTRVFLRRGCRPGSSTTSMDRRHVARFERAHVDVVYRSAALMVRDVHCSRFHPNSGPEEHSNGHTIVLVRSGLFTKTTGGETVLAEPQSRSVLYAASAVSRHASRPRRRPVHAPVAAAFRPPGRCQELCTRGRRA